MISSISLGVSFLDLLHVDSKDESIENFKESLTTIQEELNHTRDNFTKKYYETMNERKESLNFIKKYAWVVSKIDHHTMNINVSIDPTSMKVLMYPSLNKEINSSILNILEPQNMIKSSEEIDDLMKEIFKDTDYIDCIEDTNDPYYISKSLNIIYQKMVGSTKDYYTPNIEILANN